MSVPFDDPPPPRLPGLHPCPPHLDALIGSGGLLWVTVMVPEGKLRLHYSRGDALRNIREGVTQSPGSMARGTGVVTDVTGDVAPQCVFGLAQLVVTMWAWRREKVCLVASPWPGCACWPPAAPVGGPRSEPWLRTWWRSRSAHQRWAPSCGPPCCSHRQRWLPVNFYITARSSRIVTWREESAENCTYDL